jgi:galactokinase
MDQYASLACQAGAALLLDCRSLTYEQVPLALGEYTVVVVDSGVRHELVAGEYARRQAQCAEALAFFRRWQPAVRALRDVDVVTVRAHAGQMHPLAAARARHVTSENARTLAAAEALRRGDLAEMGRLMRASHASLRDDYEVSCTELDQLVGLVGALPGVLGARMTGGGFGGCIVAIARRDALATIERTLRERYDSPQHVARLLAVEPGDGAAIESS